MKLIAAKELCIALLHQLWCTLHPLHPQSDILMELLLAEGNMNYSVF